MLENKQAAAIVRSDLSAAAADIASLSRFLWSLAFPSSRAGTRARSRSQYLTIPQRAFDIRFDTDQCGADSSDRMTEILNTLIAGHFAVISEGGIRFVKTACNPLRLIRDLLGGSFPDYHLQWMLMLAIRRHYRCVPSAQVAHLFQFLAEELNRELGSDGKLPTVAPRRLVFEDLSSSLISSLGHARLEQDFAPEAVALFLECCRAVNYVQVDYNAGSIALMATSIDAEYLLSRLFGMSTSISGFDDLFGGGILLPDQFVAEPNGWSRGPILGRTILAAGRYATGKSLLALQVAVEVAKKGGVAWFMPFEQSADDCLYSLETMSALPSDGSVAIACNPLELEHHLANRSSGRGLLILLRSIKDSLDNLLGLLPTYSQRLRHYPLRLLLLDPLNAIVRTKRNVDEERKRVLAVFEELKKTGTNVWMNAEESPGSAPDHFFEQNIADTVIRLSVLEELGYTQTYMEVTKSRLQRQQRGRNPYTIQSGRGLVVSASSVSFADRIRARRVRVGTRRQTFGIPDFNRVIGPELIKSGDVIALVGPGGTFKTQVGLMFLHASGHAQKSTSSEEPEDQSRQRIRNLLIPVRDSQATVEAKLTADLVKNQHLSFSRWGEVKVCPLPSGFVSPGEILQRIEGAFLDARLARRAVERVMVDNVPHWELACPFVKGDQTFADTLLSLFRGQGCATLLTCSPIGTGSDLQKTIIDAADCVIEFSSIQARGASRVLVRVTKTRTMEHSRETFELLLRTGSIELSPDAQLLRISASNEISTVKVRLFLRSENRIQRQYNEEIRSSIESTLAPEVLLDNQSRLDLKHLPGMGRVSSMDELQILQLDEFEVSGLRDEAGASLLHRFHNSDWDSENWGDVDMRLVRAIRSKGGGFIGVPFCENISVLAYHVDRLQGPIRAQSWEALAKQVCELEDEDQGRVIFDFSQVTRENFNCLFFEILQSMLKVPQSQARDACGLQNWLKTSQALDAAVLMRRIAARSYANRRDSRQEPDRSLRPELNIELDPTASIWRTWFSTLIQMLSSLSAEEATNIAVIPLPGDITVAGEWFLGIPSHSVAPDVGLRLIRNLTTREAEFERMKRGVGLPTRPRMYEGVPLDAPLSESFRLRLSDFHRLMKEPFRRSRFSCYSDSSDILATHLQAIVALQREDRQVIRGILEGAISKVSMMQSGVRCEDCRKRGKSQLSHDTEIRE